MSELHLFRPVTDLSRFWDKSVAMLPHTFRYSEGRTQQPWNRAESSMNRTCYTIGAFWHNTNRNSHRAGFGVLEFFIYDQVLPVTDPQQLSYAQVLQLNTRTPRPPLMGMVQHDLRSMVSFYSAFKLGGQRPYDNLAQLSWGNLSIADFGGGTQADASLRQMLQNPQYLPANADGWYKVRD